MDLLKQPMPAEQHHRNSGLFSDHYLNVSLPRRTDWQGLASEAGAALERISEVFSSYTPSNNEAQTEADLIQPVLNVLGHERSYEVQPALTTPTERSVPTTFSIRTRRPLWRTRTRP